jgi:hypothetical protein
VGLETESGEMLLVCLGMSFDKAVDVVVGGERVGANMLVGSVAVAYTGVEIAEVFGHAHGEELADGVEQFSIFVDVAIYSAGGGVTVAMKNWRDVEKVAVQFVLQARVEGAEVALGTIVLEIAAAVT